MNNTNPHHTMRVESRNEGAYVVSLRRGEHCARVCSIVGCLMRPAYHRRALVSSWDGGLITSVPNPVQLALLWGILGKRMTDTQCRHTFGHTLSFSPNAVVWKSLKQSMRLAMLHLLAR